VKLPREAEIAQSGCGFQTIMREFDLSPTLLGLMCIGAAQASIDQAADYAKARQAFGSRAFPIAKHHTATEPHIQKSIIAREPSSFVDAAKVPIGERREVAAGSHRRAASADEPRGGNRTKS